MPRAPRVTSVLSASQGGVRDSCRGGRAPVLGGGEAALALQPPDAGPQAPPARAHGALRPAAAAGDSPALTALPRAEAGPAGLRYEGPTRVVHVAPTAGGCGHSASFLS